MHYWCNTDIRDFNWVWHAHIICIACFQSIFFVFPTYLISELKGGQEGKKVKIVASLLSEKETASNPHAHLLERSEKINIMMMHSRGSRVIITIIITEIQKERENVYRTRPKKPPFYDELKLSRDDQPWIYFVTFFTINPLLSLSFSPAASTRVNVS